MLSELTSKVAARPNPFLGIGQSVGTNPGLLGGIRLKNSSSVTVSSFIEILMDDFSSQRLMSPTDRVNIHKRVCILY